jgi:hypothetical protein
MSSSRKKGSKSDISSILTTPPACRKLDIDYKENTDPLEYGVFVMDD